MNDMESMPAGSYSRTQVVKSVGLRFNTFLKCEHGKSSKGSFRAGCCYVQSMRPHVQALAEKTDASWQARTISPGERAVLCDMMITSVCSADADFQRGVSFTFLSSTEQIFSCFHSWVSQGCHLLDTCKSASHVS